MKKLLFTFFLLGISVKGIACDACGCSGSLGNMGLGVQARGNRTSFSFVHSTKLYKTVIGGIYGHPDQHSFEYYNRSEFTSSIRLTHRLQSKLILPFSYNSQTVEVEQRTSYSGLGDIQVGLNYFLLDSAYTKGTIIRWSMGLGSKLPTGKFGKPDASDLMLSPGTGTFDYLLSSSFAFRKGKLGISNESSFTVRGTNKYDYHPGNTWYNQTIGLIVFNRFSFGTGISIASNALARYQGKVYNNTNTQALLLQNATVVSYSSNNWSFQLSINSPLYQQLGDGNSKQKEAVSFGIYHILKQRK